VVRVSQHVMRVVYSSPAPLSYQIMEDRARALAALSGVPYVDPGAARDAEYIVVWRRDRIQVRQSGLDRVVSLVTLNDGDSMLRE
jgi:hypothetical protein